MAKAPKVLTEQTIGEWPIEWPENIQEMAHVGKYFQRDRIDWKRAGGDTVERYRTQVKEFEHEGYTIHLDTLQIVQHHVPFMIDGKDFGGMEIDFISVLMEKRWAQDGVSQYVNIYVRDLGMCWVCGEYCHKDKFHHGHIVDRVRGGDDSADNLSVQCGFCNLFIKPLHNTREKAEAWRRWFQEEGYILFWCNPEKYTVLSKELSD